MDFIIRMQYLGHHLDRNAFDMDIADINFGFSLQFRLLGASYGMWNSKSVIIYNYLFETEM